MIRPLLTSILLSLPVSAQSVQESIRALIDEYENSVRANTQKIIAATTEEERGKYRAAVPSAAPTAEKVLALVEKNTADSGSASGVSWLVTQCAGLPQGQRALELLGTSFASSQGIAPAVKALEYQPLNVAEPILQAVRESNPNAEEQAAAAYALGVQYFRLHENAAGETERRDAKEKAMSFFQEVADKHAQVTVQGFPLADQAGKMLFEMGSLSVGDPMPVIEGTDVDGASFSLKDYLGQHVVVVFWGGWCHACHGVMPEINQFILDNKDQKMTVLGVNTDIPSEARKALEDYQVGFRNWADGATSGPITSLFNLRGFPTFYLVGPDGKILLKNTHLGAIRAELAKTQP